MRLRDDAVYLVSYPRSGNTWLRFLISNYQFPNKSIDWEAIDNAVPNINSSKFHNHHSEIVKEWNPLVFMDHTRERPEYEKLRVISIYRDGRDVALSYYHLSKSHPFTDKRYRFHGTFDEFLEWFFSGAMPYGTWMNHVERWAFNKHDNNHLVIKYEEMLQNPETTLRAIIKFLGWEYDGVALKVAIEKSQYKEVKKLGLEGNKQKICRIGHTGSAGLWRKTFTAEQRELFWNTAGGVLERLGYEV